MPPSPPDDASLVSNMPPAPTPSTSPVPPINRTRSSSHCPSSSSASTTTIDSTQKLTTTDPKPQLTKAPQKPALLDQLDRSLQDDWMASTESDLLNIDGFKERQARAKLWRGYKTELKAYVAKVRDDGISRKFEVEIKVIGR